MYLIRAVLAVAVIIIATLGHAAAFSLLDEVTVIDPNLTAELVWELADTKTYCQSSPPNPDRLACRVIDPDELAIGIDAAGNRYSLIEAFETLGTYFDVYRRPAGTNFNHHIARITKNVEEVVGQPTKIFAVGKWEIDVTNGVLLLGLKGECFTNTCVGDNDTVEHLAVIRITGLPALMDVIESYQPPSLLSFNLPMHPEGLPQGDRYDVYQGNVAGLPDFSQAQPLACDVAAGKAVGERVEVTDTLPDPGPGETRYYLTAVSSGIDQRAGRTRLAGNLVGRAASSLPPCVMP
jgi:hypothetical protein